MRTLEMSTFTQTLMESRHFHSILTFNASSVEAAMVLNETLISITNTRMSKTLIPVMVYVGILMVLGTLGNAIVCYIYFMKWKPKPVKYFIGCLASMDLITCLVCMPIEISMLHDPLTLDEPLLCKLLRFTRSVTSLSAGFMLIIIAVDRYRRICKHNMRQIHVQLAKKLCGLAIALGILFSLPSFVIFGSLDRSGGITLETSCSTDKQLSEPILPMVFYGVILLLFLIISVCLVTFYSMIGMRLCLMPTMTNTSNKRYSVAESTNSSQNDSPDRERVLKRNDHEHNSLPRKTSETQKKLINLNGRLSVIKKDLQKRVTLTRSDQSRNDTRRNSIRRRSSLSRRRQTTFTLFLITMIQWISFFPYIGLLICQSVVPDFLLSMDIQWQMVYNIGILSHFISSGINPFIYGFLGQDFREQCKSSAKELIRKVFP